MCVQHSHVEVKTVERNRSSNGTKCTMSNPPTSLFFKNTNELFRRVCFEAASHGSGFTACSPGASESGRNLRGRSNLVLRQTEKKFQVRLTLNPQFCTIIFVHYGHSAKNCRWHHSQEEELWRQ